MLATSIPAAASTFAVFELTRGEFVSFVLGEMRFQRPPSLNKEYLREVTGI
jgi:hypothetical protein